jgi:uncharacterized membrane protein YesL
VHGELPTLELQFLTMNEEGNQVEFKGWMGHFYRVSDWVTRIVYLNSLWLLFSLLGGVVFGLMPATTAMLAITNQWVAKESEVRVFAEFKRVYKREFLRSNLLGYGLVLTGGVMCADIYFFSQRTAVPFEILKFVLSGIFIVYALTALYVLPLITMYRLTWTGALRLSFVCAMTHVFRTVFVGIVIMAIILCGFLFPSFTLLAAASLSGLWLSKNVRHASQHLMERAASRPPLDGQVCESKANESA